MSKTNAEIIPFPQSGLTEAQRFHGERIAERRRINGQPNGYEPVSQATLRRERNFDWDRFMTAAGVSSDE